MPLELYDPGKNSGAGDQYVSKCNVISTLTGKHLKDLIPRAWHAIVFTESMGLFKGHTQFLSGEIIIIDNINIINAMKINMNDVVELTFKTPQKREIDFVGKIYQVDMSNFESKRALILKFCSGEKLVSDQIKYNGAFRGIPYSTMAERLFAPLKDVSGKTIFCEPTRSSGASYVINNKSPLDALNSIKKVSRSEKYMGANYVFYERSTSRGSEEPNFRFESIESLTDPKLKKTSMIYSYDAPGASPGSPESHTRLTSWRVVAMPNLVSMTKGGGFAATAISNDLMKRKVEYRTFNLEKEYDNLKHVNYNSVAGASTTLLKNSNLNARKHSHIHFIPKHYGSMGLPGSSTGFSAETVYGDDKAEIALVRNSQLKNLTAIQLSITVPGDSNRRVGEKIEIRIPSPDKKYKVGDGRTDAMLSGDYLVTNVKHSIGSEPNSYITHMHIVKDSYSTPL